MGSRFGSGRSEKPENLRYKALPRRREVPPRRRPVVAQTSKSASKLTPGRGFVFGSGFLRAFGPSRFGNLRYVALPRRRGMTPRRRIVVAQTFKSASSA
jgi:hypothetical protein